MAFADPQSITIAAGGTLVGTTSLPKVGNSDPKKSVYADATSAIRMEVTQNYGSRHRASIRFVFSKVATDPLIPANNAPYSASLILSVDTPLVGMLAPEVLEDIKGALGTLAATSYADWTKLLGGEQ